MIKTKIAGWKHYDASALPAYFNKRLRADLTFPNPEYVGLERHRPEVLRKLRAKGEEPPSKILVYREQGGEILVPRNYEMGADESVVQCGRVVKAAEWPSPLWSLRSIQGEAVAAWKSQRRTDGIFVLPTGAGKTVLGLELARQAKQRLLVLTNRGETGLKSWTKDAFGYLGIEPGVISGERVRFADEPVVVAMFQTLWSQPNLIAELKDEFGMVVVDECHRVPAHTFCEMTNAFPARYRYGMTATDQRSDGLEPIMFYTLGDLIFERRQAEEVLPVDVKFVRLGILMPRLEEVAGDYNKSLKYLCLHDFRNQRVAETVVQNGRGYTNLVVTHRVRHAKVLANLISSIVGVERVGLLVSDPKKQEPRTVPVNLKDGIDAKQSSVIMRARAGKIDYVVATVQYVREGLDIPRFGAIHLTTPIGNEIELIQTIGRVRRAFPGQTRAKVFDYVDPSGFCHNKFLFRQRIYRKLAKQARDAAQAKLF